MIRGLAVAAACVIAASGTASAQGAPVPLAPPIILARPPAGVSQATRSRLVDAMIAIARAEQTNPAAAQNASFAYARAIQRLQMHDSLGAQQEAARALMMANMPVPLVIATIAPFTPPIRTRSIITGDPGYADATAFVALARGALAQCSASGTARTQAQHDLTDAEAALAKNNPQAVRRLAKSAIDTCATPNR